MTTTETTSPFTQAELDAAVERGLKYLRRRNGNPVMHDTLMRHVIDGKPYNRYRDEHLVLRRAAVATVISHPNCTTARTRRYQTAYAYITDEQREARAKAEAAAKAARKRRQELHAKLLRLLNVPATADTDGLEGIYRRAASGCDYSPDDVVYTNADGELDIRSRVITWGNWTLGRSRFGWDVYDKIDISLGNITVKGVPVELIIEAIETDRSELSFMQLLMAREIHGGKATCKKI